MPQPSAIESTNTNVATTRNPRLPCCCNSSKCTHTDCTEPWLSLEPLHPMPLLPSHKLSKRSWVMYHLRRIQFIHVQKSNMRRSAKTIFSVSIYYRDAHSRIPIHATQCMQQDLSRGKHLPVALPPTPRGPPSLQVELEFAAFARLRLDIYRLARGSHGCETCSFCQTLICFHALGRSWPRWITLWLKSKQTTCELLSAYLTELLHLVTRVSTDGPDYCDGQRLVPCVLLRFLIVRRISSVQFVHLSEE